MKKIVPYLNCLLIGMIAEYSFRVEFSYIQGFILGVLTLGMIIDIIDNWYK